MTLDHEIHVSFTLELSNYGHRNSSPDLVLSNPAYLYSSVTLSVICFYGFGGKILQAWPTVSLAKGLHSILCYHNFGYYCPNLFRFRSDLFA